MGVALFLTIWLFFVGLYQYKTSYSVYLLNSLKGPMKYNNEELIQYIRNEILEPPSIEEYDFNTQNSPRNEKEASEFFYANYTRMFFNSNNRGFFVEAGALDGQVMSNTLWLEKKLGWTGLLIEPDPSSYKLLRKKHRKVWSAEACLAVNNFPKQEKLSTRDLLTNRGGIFLNNPKLKAVGYMVKEGEVEESLGGANSLFFSYYIGQCFSLNSLLLALDVKQVDLLSLDVESVEEDVILSLDFDRFNIQVLYLEWKLQDKLIWLRDFMKKKGFVYVDNDLEDIIFVKIGSKYEQIANTSIGPKRKMKLWHIVRE